MPCGAVFQLLLGAMQRLLCQRQFLPAMLSPLYLGLNVLFQFLDYGLVSLLVLRQLLLQCHYTRAALLDFLVEFSRPLIAALQFLGLAPVRGQ